MSKLKECGNEIVCESERMREWVRAWVYESKRMCVVCGSERMREWVRACMGVSMRARECVCVHLLAHLLMFMPLRFFF
jgi:hypothetical protein